MCLRCEKGPGAAYESLSLPARMAHRGRGVHSGLYSRIMASSAPAEAGAPTPTRRRWGWPRGRGAWYGLAFTVLLVAAAMIVPVATGWDVWATFPPLLATWAPRLRYVSALAAGLALAGVWWGEHVAGRLRWSRLLPATWLVTALWSFSLALVDGRVGLGPRYDTYDFLKVARHTTSVSALLHEFVSRITGPGHWPTHVAGHPPGALLFFIALDRLGLGAGMDPGIILTLLAATTPVAVLVALRALGLERLARVATPFLVLGPVVIWETVSADALYGCVAAWCLATAAVAASRRSRTLAVAAGVLLGGCLLVSYGLVLWPLAILAVLGLGRRLRLAAWVAVGAAAVLAACWLLGFELWAAYPAIHTRYWNGIASLRPDSYWLWADLAALCISAGPAVGIAIGNGVQRWWAARRGGPPLRSDERGVLLIGTTAVLMVVLADASLMSKAEVERIWIPFVPWLLVLTSLLPTGWRRPALVLQVATALALQYLLFTAW